MFYSMYVYYHYYNIKINLQQNAEVGDEFMRQLEPVASYLPYMTCAGNHEQK